jgi:predicted permease
MIAKFAYSFGIILFGLLSGYVVQILVQRSRLHLPIPIDQLRLLLQKIALLFVNPIAIVGAIWIVSIQDVRLVALPFNGVIAILSGGALALLAARILSLEPHKTGAIFGCGCFTNIGSIGALVCFVVLGEAGFALAPIYKLFEELTYYSVGFPIAKYYSSSVDDEPVSRRLKGLLRDPFIIVALSSIVLGGVLNYSDITRPAVFKPIVAICVPLGTVLLLSSIGMALKFRRVRDYLKECIAVSLIKFLLVPVIAASVAYFIGFGSIDNGLPLKVVIILSAMPVAFTAMIPPSIYGLDLDLANSCWFFTTAMLAVILPLLLIVTSLL